MERPDSPVRAIRRQEARPAQAEPLPDTLQPVLRSALAQRGITELYTHQADAFRHTRDGKNVIVVTPTASGKTLCYNLPVLDTLVKDPSARAVYLFPTKALAEDQLHELHAAIEAAGGGVREIVAIHLETNAAESLLVSAPFCLETDEGVFLVVEFAIDEGGDDVDEFELVAGSEMFDLHGEGFLEFDDVVPAGVELFQMEPDALGGRRAERFEALVFLTRDPEPQE